MYKKKTSSVIALIPSYNEYNNLKKNIFRIKKYFDVLIVDDGSTDKTNFFLRKNKISFIKNIKNKGYERSLIIGFKKIFSKKKIKHIITMDADGQHKVKDAIKILNLCLKHNASLVIGARKKQNRISEFLLSKLFNFKYNIMDPISGMKVYNVKKLKKINLEYKNLFLVDLVVKFLKKNFKTLYSQVNFYKRKDKPRVGGNLSVNLKIIKILFYCLVS